jgi:2-oxoisovalerate dehydrogenase E1 component alpha subunit
MFNPTEGADGGTDTSFVQLLTPAGERVTTADHTYSGDAAAIAELYRQMVLIRRFDAEGFALQRHGELGLWPPMLGQEAGQVGPAAALGPADYVYGTYREAGIGWLMGVDLADLLAIWRGSTMGSWDLHRHRFAPLSIVIGSHPLHATGHAMGMALRSEGAPETPGGAVLTYFGDGASSQGDVWEAMEFATLHRAPVVFFCQNNHYAISHPVERQSAQPIIRRADSFGIPGIQVDGNDVLACQSVAAAALERARTGGGPTLIEAVTYRMGPHTTSDDPTRYRDAAEVEAWHERDPIDRVRRYLEANGTPASFFASVESKAEALGETVRRTCLSIPEPDLAAWFDMVYAEQTDELRAQQAEYVAWRAQYGGAA